MQATKTPGVYKITNDQTHQVYYGSTKDYEHRVAAHRSTLRLKKHSNPLIQMDYDNGHTFSFELIEVIEDRTDRTKREKEIISSDSNCYNMVGSPSPAGLDYKARTLMRLHSEETQDKKLAHRKGRPRRPETTAKIVAANTGKKRSAESRAKMSAAAKARPAVECSHCGKIGKGPFMHLNHFDNCKLSPSIT